MFRNRPIHTVCAVGLTLGALAACGGESTATVRPGEGTLSGEELVSAAQKEGEVSFYCSVVPEECEALEAGFEERYPDIDVVVNRQTSSDISARYAAEKESNAATADVILHSDYPFIVEAMDSGLLTSYEDAGYLPADYPAAWVAGDVGTPFFTEVLGIAYNTDKVAEGEVSSWEDLLDPQWKGKMTNLDVEALAVASTLLGTVGDTLGEDYLAALAAQDVTPNRGGMVALTESLGAGEFAIQVFASAQVVADAAEKGSPVAIAFPENATGSPFFFTLNPEPDHGYAQQLFAEYVVSEDGAQALAASNDSVAAAYAQPDFSTVPPNMAYFDDAEREKIIAIMTR